MSPTIFKRYAPKLVQNGYSPLPIKLGTKRPGFGSRLLRQWSGACSCVDTFLIDSWLRSGLPAGIAVACGYGGLIAVDVDDPLAAPVVRTVLKRYNAPAVKLGRKGATAFFRDPTGSVRSKAFRRWEAGQPTTTLVDILAAGRSCTLPPTPHPDGGAYRWARGSLYTVPLNELPVLGPDVIPSLEAELAPLMNKPVRERKMEIAEPSAAPTSAERYGVYARAALASAIQGVALSAKGARSHQLFLAACGIGKWVHHGILQPREVTEMLFDAAKQCGLVAENGNRDVRMTIANGIDKARGDSLPVLKEKHGSK